MARHFDDWTAAFVAHRRISEAPEIAQTWVALWTIAGALRRNVWYEAGGFEWTPNMYTVLVGPPGVIQKSTTASHGSRLLKRVPSVVFGPDSATWHGLLPRFAAAEAVTPTSDGLVKTSPLSMAVSELGSFLKLSQEGLDAVLIDMWDGAISQTPWTHTTQTHGDKLVWNGLLNLLGCTTLGWARANIPASALETGLISRILFVYADAKKRVVSIPKLDPEWRLEASRDTAKRLGDDLRDIATLRGPFELTPDAYGEHDAWYKRLWSERPAHMASERFDVYRSRKQSHVFKVAMALAAGRAQHPTIPAATLRDAVALVDAVEAGIVRIFETIGGPAEAQHTREVVALVARSGEAGLAVPRLLRALGSLMKHDELKAAIRNGLATGRLRQHGETLIATTEIDS